MEDGTCNITIEGGWKVAANPAWRGEKITPERVAEALRTHDAETLQGGRNLTVKAFLRGADGEQVPVVIKRFGKQSLLKDAISRKGGSKAERAYRAAFLLSSRGIGTPAPFAFLERWSGSRLAESYLVTEYVGGMESFHHRLCGLYSRNCPCEELMALIERVAVFAAGMHDAGYQHRDFGNQNIVFARDASGAERIMAIDLNRGRIFGRPLTNNERARDISRINLPSDIMRVFNEMYWRGDVPPPDYLKAEQSCRARYAIHTSTRHLRHPFRERVKSNPDGDLPAPRDIFIWDERSAQAISAYRRRERNKLRLPGRVTGSVVAVVRHGPRAWREFKRLAQSSFGAPVDNVGERVGVAIEAAPETFGRELELLREMQVKRVLVRICHYRARERRQFALEAVRTLARNGFMPTVSLVQDRNAVLDASSWDAMGREALSAVGDVVERVEVSHATNRVKWGAWGYQDVARLFAPLSEWRRDFPGVRFSGPACIDFEYDFVLAALDELPRGVQFDELSHLLYVDRQGAPETKHRNYDAVDKLALASAIASTSGKIARPGVVVTEFNWPLAGEGVWSPVGSPYVSPGVRTNDPSVDESLAAAYAVRYALLGVCSGFAENMFFWRLAARGFGLVDDTDAANWRKRPAFNAFKEMHAHLNGARFAEMRRDDGGKIALSFIGADGSPMSASFGAGDSPAYEVRSLRQPG